MKNFLIFLLSFILISVLPSCYVIMPVATTTPTKTDSVTPSPSPNPSITPTINPEPIFPESGIMRSEHITASLSKTWMDTAGLKKVALKPEILERIYQAMLVHWTSTLASFSHNSNVQLFKDYYSCDTPDPNEFFDFSLYKPKAHLNNALDAYKENSQKNKPFNYLFDFGQGITGIVKGIDIKALANEQEYKFIESELKNQGILFAYQFGSRFGFDDKSMIYFDSRNILHIYTWDGNPFTMQYLDHSVDNSYALLHDLFINPQVNGGVSILRANYRKYQIECHGYSMHEALGCENYFCNQSGKTPSNFEIMLNDGTVFAPSLEQFETIIQTPTPQLIMASNKPLQIEDHSIFVSDVQILDVGTNPLGLNSNLALSVYFTVANRDIQELYSLTENDFWVTDENGNKNENIIIQSATSQDGTKFDRLIIYISQPSKAYYLHFNFWMGEVVIDLTPLLK